MAKGILSQQSMQNKKIVDNLTQIMLPSLTLGSQLLVALKYPEFGLIANLLAQPFWLYSTWRGYKKAGQIGMFITTVIMTVILIGGVINYWFL